MRFFYAFFLTLVCLAFLSAGGIVLYGFRDTARPGDVAIVFGSQVHRDGAISPRLRARLDKAIALYREGFFPAIIVSGGTGVEGFDESAIMKKYLVQQGIPAESVVTDGKGDTTYATALHTRDILRKKNWQHPVLITQYFHIARCKLAFWKAGLLNVTTAHANFFELRDFYSILREVAGFYAYMFKSFPRAS